MEGQTLLRLKCPERFRRELCNAVGRDRQNV